MTRKQYSIVLLRKPRTLDSSVLNRRNLFAECLRHGKTTVVSIAVLFLLFAAIVRAEPSTEVVKRWKSAIANDSVAKLRQMWEASDYDHELLAVRSDNGKSALMIASKTGDMELFEAILAAGEDPELSLIHI